MKIEELLKIAKPILFNTDMVKAILDGRETVTRRLIKPQPKFRLCYTFAGGNHGTWSYPNDTAHEFWGEEYRLPDCVTDGDKKMVWKPPYNADDILYVRETWLDYAGRFMYKADCDKYRIESIKLAEFNWRPSIHMPKEAARIFLKVTDVRVERLQDITEEQAEAEGISEEWAMSWWKPTYYDPDSGGYPKYRDTFAFDLWNSTIKKSDLEQYGWESNPWVWVIEFEREEAEQKLKDMEVSDE